MSFKSDLYDAFSNALVSGGKASATLEIVSQGMANDITDAIVKCIKGGVATTSYTGDTLSPEGTGAVAVGVGAVESVSGKGSFSSALYALFLDISNGSLFNSKFASLVKDLVVSVVVVDSYAGTTIPPDPPPVDPPPVEPPSPPEPVSFSGFGSGTISFVTKPVIKDGVETSDVYFPDVIVLGDALNIPNDYVPVSAEEGNNFVAGKWAEAITYFFSKGVLNMRGDASNPDLVGVGRLEFVDV